MIRTGWSRLTTGWGTTTSAESAAIDQLLNTHRALLLDGGRAEVGSEAGYSACAIFLSSVETAAKTFGLEAAPRGYRKKFSANYRALFPDDARHYRVDVLEASADQHSAIWVNGDKFELSPEAICHAEALQKAWSDLTQLLDASAAAPDGCRHPGRSELCAVLDSLDVAWAGFEHKYIAELIEIEEQARRLIIKAVELEAKLATVEDAPQKGKETVELQRALVQGIAHLNSVANFRRKERDDLGFDILESASEVLSKFGLSSKDIVAAGEGKGFAAAAIQDAVSRSAGVSMAVDVVGSFEAMRRYLREVKKCLERVDPHLCNNVGLVARQGLVCLATNPFLQIIKYGHAKHAWMGIYLSMDQWTEKLSRSLERQGMPRIQGALVLNVEPGSPAELAGLRPTLQSQQGILLGDEILAVDGKEVKSSDDIAALVDDKGIGETVEVTFLRRQRCVEKLTTKLTLTERPKRTHVASTARSNDPEGVPVARPKL